MPDTEAPTVPTELTAQLNDVSVQLNWSASTDNVGVTHYKIERSLDQTTWTTSGDDITATQFSDTDTAFDVHYYYRVKAYDAAGNASPYATADVQTKAFSSNATSAETTITSDDGRATAIIPAGALSENADCSMVFDEDSSKVPRGKQEVLAGPYTLVCKKQSGDSIDTYSSPVTFRLGLTAEQLKKYGNISVLQVDNDKWSVVKPIKLDTKSRGLSFASNKPTQFVVLGTAKVNYWPLILSIFLPLLIVGGGIFYFKFRQQKQAQYRDYIRRKYYNL